MDAKLAMKIFKVMEATKNLEKDMTVGTGNNKYKAIGEATVLNMIKPLLIENKLICLPFDGEIDEHVTSYVDSYEKKKFRGITQLIVKFKLVDAETGEEAQIIGFGNGADSQDKGSGKAFTYAYKTALQKTFCMFSGEDSDNNHSDDYNQSNGNDSVDQVTTKMLQDALNSQNNITLEQVLKTYESDTGKKTDQLKFIAQEYKQKYYKLLKGE